MTAYKISYKRFQNVNYKFVFKSLNHKFLSIDIKLPEKLISLEKVIRQRIQNKVRRGSIQFSITSSSDPEVLNKINIEQIKKTLQFLKDKGISVKEISISDIFQISHWLTTDEKEPPKTTQSFILKVVDSILEEAQKQKEKEGYKMQKVIEKVVNKIEMYSKKIENMLPSIYREKERTLIRKLTQFDKMISKFKGETGMTDIKNTEFQKVVVTYFLPKSIYEEIERLKIHIKHFKDELKKEASAKELDFLCQEMHREISTLLVKVENAKVSQLGVKIKQGIEDIREILNNAE
jgi:uncharacterized protein (TIGR00255 family)